MEHDITYASWGFPKGAHPVWLAKNGIRPIRWCPAILCGEAQRFGGNPCSMTRGWVKSNYMSDSQWLRLFDDYHNHMSWLYSICPTHHNNVTYITLTPNFGGWTVGLPFFWIHQAVETLGLFGNWAPDPLVMSSVFYGNWPSRNSGLTHRNMAIFQNFLSTLTRSGKSRKIPYGKPSFSH